MMDARAGEPDVISALKSEVPSSHLEALRRANFPMRKLHTLMRRRPARALTDMALAACWLVSVPILYAAYPGPLTFVVCFVLSIRTFNCLAQIVHTSDHGGLFEDQWLNRMFGNLCAYCLGYTRTGHRLTHIHHHMYLNTEKDPDRIWGTPEQSARELIRMWLRDLLFVSAIERLLQYAQSDRKSFTVAPWKTLTLGFLGRAAVSMYPVILAQGVIVTLYTFVLGPVYYLLLYVLPIMTFYPAQIRLRSTVEHSYDVGYRPKSAEEFWVVRSTRGHILERFIVAPFGIQFHFEHHLFPSIPYYNLLEVRRLLAEYGIAAPVVSSYVGFVHRKMQAEKGGR